MKLFHLAALVAWFTFALAGVAIADPVTAAIGWLATSTIGKLVLGVALQVGKSLLDRARQKKQGEPGITGQIQVGGTNSFSFIVGTYATAGQLEYPGTYGRVGKTPNAGLIQVFTLSDLPVHAINNRAWINGEECNRDPGATIIPNSHACLGAGSFPFTEYKSGDYYFLFAKYLLGHQTTADTALLSRLGSGDRPWMSDMIGRGLAQVILSAEVKRELFKGFPAGRWQVDGLPLYDPRKDSTVGGSGSHRWNPDTAGTTASTYEFTNNPAVIIYNILRGIYYRGEWVYGPEVAALALPLANWFAAMNECDRPIARAGGGTEPQFRCGYEIKVEENEPADVIDELLTGCNGRIAELGGTFKIHVGAPGLPVYFFTDDDIEVLNSPQSFDPFPGYQSVFNGVSASYPEPSNGWDMKDAPRYVNAAHVAADGEERLAPVTYNAVPYPNQVQRLMRSTAEDNRRFRRHQITLPPEAWLLEPLDVVAWSSARNGYETKHFPITSMDDLDNVNQNVALQEADPTDYDWSPSFELPWSVGSLTPNRPPAQLLTGWQVAPAIIYDEQGRARRPSIQVYFDGDLEDVREVRIVVRLAVDETVVFDALLPYGDPIENQNPRSVILNGTFLPNENYEVSGVLIPVGPRSAVWSAWLPVTTPDVRLGGDDIYLDGVVDDIIEFMDDAYGFIGPQVREVIDEARRLTASIMDQAVGDYQDRQQIRVELSSTFENVTANYTEAITVATGPGSAIVLRIEELRAEVFDPVTGLPATAEAVNLVSTRVDTVEGGLESVADSITALTASYNDVSASANFRMSASAGPSGYAARIGMEARADGSGAFRAASLFLDVPTSTSQPTRIVLAAEQVVLANAGATTRRPFVYQGNTLYLDEVVVEWAKIVNANITWAQIDTAVINNLTINDGMIPANLITDADQANVTGLTIVSNTSGQPINWQTVLSVTVNSPALLPVLLFISARISATQTSASSANLGFRMLRNGVPIPEETHLVGFNDGSTGVSRSYTYPYVVQGFDASTTNATFTLQAMAQNMNNNQPLQVTANLVAQRPRH